MFTQHHQGPSGIGSLVAPADAHLARKIPTVAVLVEALRSPSALVRGHSARQLGRLVALAIASIPALQTAVFDKNGKVGRAARSALRQIQQQQPRGKP